MVFRNANYSPPTKFFFPIQALITQLNPYYLSIHTLKVYTVTNILYIVFFFIGRGTYILVRVRHFHCKMCLHTLYKLLLLVLLCPVRKVKSILMRILYAGVKK